MREKAKHYFSAAVQKDRKIFPNGPGVTMGWIFLNHSWQEKIWVTGSNTVNTPFQPQPLKKLVLLELKIFSRNKEFLRKF